MKKYGSLALVTPLVVFFATGASAQRAGTTDQSAGPVADQGGQIEQVVVTARKREENVQTMAATVQVLDATAIEKFGVTDFRDISIIAPSVNISNAPTVGLFALTVRGLGTPPGSHSIDSSVVPFVDGVFTPRIREFADAMFDLSNIEVVHGTQAAILGKDTSLGAINMVTTKPGDSYEFNLTAEHEFELNSSRVEGGFDIPVTDTLKFRISGLYNDIGGPIRDTVSGKHGVNDQNRAGRIIMVWNPTASLDVTAMYQTQVFDTSGPGTEFVSSTNIPGGPCAGHPVGYCIIAAQDGAGFLVPPIDPSLFTSGVPYKTAAYSPALGDAENMKEWGQRGTVTINLKLGDYTVTSQTGYTGSLSDFNQNVAYVAGNAYLQRLSDASRQFTQEFRITSPAGERLDYIAGVYYIYGRYINHNTYVADLPPGLLPPTAPVCSATAPATCAVEGSELTNFNQYDRAYSAFAQGDYKIWGPLKLTGSVRYTTEKKNVYLNRVETLTPAQASATANLGNCSPLPACVTTPGSPGIAFLPLHAVNQFVLAPTPFGLTNKEDSLDGQGGLSYEIQPDTMLYASWGQGTKAGGFANQAANLALSQYAPEVAQTIEVGMKGQFFQHRLTANIAGFDTAVHNFQLVSFTGINFLVTNTDLRSLGVESEINWMPLDDVRLYWNNTYADSYNTRFNNAVPAFPLNVGAAIPFAPLWSGVVGASYNHNVFGSMVASVDVALNYRSQETSQQDPDAVPHLKDLAQLNVTLGLSDPDRGWNVRLIGKNLNDQHAEAFMFAAPLEPAGNYIGSPLNPRTVALQVGYKY